MKYEKMNGGFQRIKQQQQQTPMEPQKCQVGVGNFYIKIITQQNSRVWFQKL